jgi:tRNA pseudouridine55 synthase
LDPAASGVLPLAVGQATRLLPYLPEEKAYRGRIRFGVKTTTDDLQGEVLETHSTGHLKLGDMEALLPDFLGKITQIPPRYSAIQIQGKRLYDLARSGEIFEVPSRQVDIFSLNILDWQTHPYPELELEIECGAGTYIRSLARDWGDRLGVGATLAALVRTRSSGFDLEESLTFKEISAQHEQGELCLINPAIVLQHLPTVRLESSEILPWSQGKKLARLAESEILKIFSQADYMGDIRVVVYDPNDRFLGIGQCTLLESEKIISKINLLDISEDLRDDTPERSSVSCLSNSLSNNLSGNLYYRLAPRIVFPIPSY